LADADTIVTQSRDPRPRPPTSENGRARIGKYEVVRLIGRGGMGVVYEAFDPLLERSVALKVMLPEVAGDREHKERFEREARAVARLSHPGVVTVFDLGYHTDGSPYIVMELLRGTDLLARTREGPSLSLAEKIDIVARVLDGLGHAHKAGIVHRDVKPANVFLTEEGTPKIMDFGIAFWTSSGGTSRSVIGTVGYMSPEQVRGERVDGRSDLFSVGTLLCELATGRRPFDAETPMATFHRIANGQPLIDLPPDPEHQRLLPVLRQALAGPVSERYPTAQDFATALRACAGEAVNRGATTPTEPAPLPDRSVPSPGGSPRGRADPTRLFRLLREIHVAARSGHLHLSVAGERKSLSFLRGRIVHGTSDTAGEHMGDVLVRYGIIGQADLDRALAVVLRERRKLGTVLQELGLLDRSRVEEAVGLHARDILFGAVERPGVSCGFEDLAEDLMDAGFACAFSTGQLILEATRRILDPDMVKVVLGDLERVLILAPHAPLQTHRMTLTPADGFVLSRIDGMTSAREVIALAPLPAEAVERSLFSLLCTGVVDFSQEAAAAARTAARTVARKATPPDGRAPLPPPPAPSARREPDASPCRPGPAPAPPGPEGCAGRSAEEIRSLVRDLHGRIREDHFEVLGLERTASQADIREAYLRLARVLHPDAGQGSALADLAREREAVFIRVSEAHQTLRDPSSRAAYEQAVEPRRRRVPAAPSFRAAPPPPVTPPPVTPPPVTPPPVAPPPEAPSPGAVPPAAAPSATSVLDASLLPERILAVAEAFFAEGRFWDAIQQLEPMIPRANEPTRRRARMLLARAYQKNPMWIRRSEGILLALLEEEPGDTEAGMALGGLYRDAGLRARARSVYRRILDARPGLAGMAEALAEVEAEASASAPDSQPGSLRNR
jgi:serine/threonine protein kinase